MTEQAKRGPGRPRKNSEPDAIPTRVSGEVKVRILPMGDGKVSDGKGAYTDDEGAIRFSRAKKGDQITVAREIGERLEARGFAEIV